MERSGKIPHRSPFGEADLNGEARGFGGGAFATSRNSSRHSRDLRKARAISASPAGTEKIADDVAGCRTTRNPNNRSRTERKRPPARFAGRNMRNSHAKIEFADEVVVVKLVDRLAFERDLAVHDDVA